MARPNITARSGELFFLQLKRVLDWLEANGGGGGGGPTEWGDITGSIGAQTDLQSALTGKSNASHGHAQADVTGLVADLAAKQAALVSGTTIKTINGNTVLGAGDLVVTGASSFETVSRNLAGVAGTPAYTGKKITSISYAGGITKTIAYGGNNLPSTITLSGATPGGINLVKALAYSGKRVTGWSYS